MGELQDLTWCNVLTTTKLFMKDYLDGAAKIASSALLSGIQHSNYEGCYRSIEVERMWGHIVDFYA